MPSLATFKSQFKGDIVTSGDADYQQAIARWAINAQRRAEVVAFVRDTADVAVAINYARDNNLQIAIRGGGHSPAGASSSEDGLVIDLSRYITGAKVDSEQRLIHVGGGAIWETVDKEAIKHGLATVAGTVNHTGVGGLTLGGGYGWLSGSHGLVIDNLVEATVVTADGSVHKASEAQNPDLFFAIRGGGSNFGVVTEFTFKLHPQRKTVYAGILVFAPSALQKLVEVTAAWWPKAGEKEALLQVLGLGPDGNPAIILVPFYNGTEAEGRENFKAFLDIGPIVDLTKELPYEEVNAIQNAAMPHGQGVYFKAVAHKKPNYETAAKALEKATSISGSDFKASVVFEYFPGTKISSVPRGATAFRRDPTATVLFLCLWKENAEENNQRARAVTYELAHIINSGQSGLTEAESLGYSNYDPEGVTGREEAVADKAKVVFGENYPRLQATKKRYDPDNIFNKWFPITPT